MKRVTTLELKNIEKLIETAFSVISTEEPILYEPEIPEYIYADALILYGSGKKLLTSARQFHQMYEDKNTNVKKRSLSFFVAPLSISRLYSNSNELPNDKFEQKLYSSLTEASVLYSKFNLEIEKIVHNSLDSHENELPPYEEKLEELIIVNHGLIRAINNLSSTLSDFIE